MIYSILFNRLQGLNYPGSGNFYSLPLQGRGRICINIHPLHPGNGRHQSDNLHYNEPFYPHSNYSIYRTYGTRLLLPSLLIQV